jgi:N-acetylneuraminic acid mutarotase
MYQSMTRRTAVKATLAVAASLAGPARLLSAQEATPSPKALVWRQIAPLPVARSEIPGVVLAGAIYVCGGFGGDTRVDRYDPETDAWTQVADLPVGVNHPGIAEDNGRIYVAGGYGEDLGALDNLQIYDPAVDAWDAGASLPEPIGAFGLVPFEEKLYLVGGALEGLGGPVSGAVRVYDPASDSWSDGPEMLTPREHLAVVAADDRIFAVGGRANGSEDDQLAGANEALDLAAMQWSEVAPLPVPRGGLSGVYAAETVIILGGERGDKAFDDVNQYDPATDQWSKLPKMTQARHGMPAGAIDRTIYAISGAYQARTANNTPESQAMFLG